MAASMQHKVNKKTSIDREREEKLNKYLAQESELSGYYHKSQLSYMNQNPL